MFMNVIGITLAWAAAQCTATFIFVYERGLSLGRGVLNQQLLRAQTLEDKM